MTANETIFRKRNNVYYVSLLSYVIFAVVYILVTGTITSDTVEFGFRDPVVYIICVFILHSILMLVLHSIRNPRLIFTESSLVFRTRFRERVIRFSQISAIVLTRERRRWNDGTFTLVKLRVPFRRRWIRIRVSAYEREQELYETFKELKNELHSEE